MYCMEQYLHYLRAGIVELLFFDILRGFEIYYPNWYMNLYLKRLPIYKRIFLFCVKRKWILFLALIARIHTKIVS